MNIIALINSNLKIKLLVLTLLFGALGFFVYKQYTKPKRDLLIEISNFYDSECVKLNKTNAQKLVWYNEFDTLLMIGTNAIPLTKVKLSYNEYTHYGVEYNYTSYHVRGTCTGDEKCSNGNDFFSIEFRSVDDCTDFIELINQFRAEKLDQ